MSRKTNSWRSSPSQPFTLIPLSRLLILPITRYPNLYEVRLIPTKRDIAFVEYIDEGSAGVAKDALHNYKLDGENKIKACISFRRSSRAYPFHRSLLHASNRLLYDRCKLSVIRHNLCLSVWPLHVNITFTRDSNDHIINALRPCELVPRC